MGRDSTQVTAMLDEFASILEKRAGNLHPVMELAGLGTLAAPHLFGKKTQVGKFLHRHIKGTELAGLGLLAVPSALDLLKKKKDQEA